MLMRRYVTLFHILFNFKIINNDSKTVPLLSPIHKEENEPKVSKSLYILQ